jgi:hypothetical protein
MVTITIIIENACKNWNLNLDKDLLLSLNVDEGMDLHHRPLLKSLVNIAISLCSGTPDNQAIHIYECNKEYHNKL